MSWHQAPPSQYVEVRDGPSAPLWVVVVVCLVSLAVGLGGGMVLNHTNESRRVDPSAPRPAKRRAALVRGANANLAALVQLDAAVIEGGPTTYGAVLLGKERHDVCVTGRSGLFVRDDPYDYACGVQVSWYLAVRYGDVQVIEAAARQRFAARRIPILDTAWTRRRRAPARKITGSVNVVPVRSATGLAGWQRTGDAARAAPARVYYEATTTFDLPAAYRRDGRRRPVVARISVTAQYAWR